jgi:hypothetical protein
LLESLTQVFWQGTIQETINPDAIIPVTLLTTREIFGNVDSLLHLFDVFDDVFIPEFGSVLVEKTPENSTDINALRDVGLTQDLFHLDASINPQGLEDLPSGPYILYGPNLYQAWRLYDDYLEAFTVGAIPEDIYSPDV